MIIIIIITIIIVIIIIVVVVAIDVHIASNLLKGETLHKIQGSQTTLTDKLQ